MDTLAGCITVVKSSDCPISNCFHEENKEKLDRNLWRFLDKHLVILCNQVNLTSRHFGFCFRTPSASFAIAQNQA